ncbi:MAG TPA: hypothetical protein VGM44_13430 [Polyangiaceae bacterium]|jgi:hypothetical protein
MKWGIILGVLGALTLMGCTVPDASSAAVAAPFTVSDYFVPSGYEGDASVLGVDPKAIVVDYSCKPRPAGAHGVCYRYTYTPVPVAEKGVGWGGVEWQSPADNWGQDQPQPVTPNATHVSFYAGADSDGEAVQFLVGGLSATDPDGAPLPYADQIKATLSATLTTELTRYDIALPTGANYNYVVGAFGFSIEASGGTPQTLYLDDIRWLPAN